MSSAVVRSRPDIPAIPPPSPTVPGLMATVGALKLAMDGLTGQSGNNAVIRLVDFQQSVRGISGGSGSGSILLDNAVKQLHHIFDVEAGTIKAELEKSIDDSTTLLQSHIDSLSVTVGSNTSAITSEQTVRANADTVLGGRIDTLTLTVGDNTTSISSEILARQTADTGLGVRIDSLTVTVSGNTASITTESAARVSADGVLSGQITTAQAQLDQATASGNMQLVAVASPQSGVAAEFSVNVRANDGVSFAQTGLRLRAMTSGGSELLIQTQKFILSSGASTDGTGTDYVPFSITVNGLESNAVLNGSLLVNGSINAADKIQAASITADRMNVTSLSAISAAFGSAAFSGQVYSAAHTMLFDATNNQILIADAPMFQA